MIPHNWSELAIDDIFYAQIPVRRSIFYMSNPGDCVNVATYFEESLRAVIFSFRMFWYYPGYLQCMKEHEHFLYTMPIDTYYPSFLARQISLLQNHMRQLCAYNPLNLINAPLIAIQASTQLSSFNDYMPPSPATDYMPPSSTQYIPPVTQYMPPSPATDYMPPPSQSTNAPNGIIRASIPKPVLIPTSAPRNQPRMETIIKDVIVKDVKPINKRKRKVPEGEDFAFIDIVKKRRLGGSNQGESQHDLREQLKKCHWDLFERRRGFELTDCQKRTIEEIESDIANGKNDRVVLAPVGAGKTEIALTAALSMVTKQRQVIVLSPMRHLTQQHYDNFTDRFNRICHVGLITKANTALENKVIMNKFKAGKISILCGTHNLLTSYLEANDLGLIVIDEEQKFGVQQKSFLVDKFPKAYSLILTATPIPRTQALIEEGLYECSIVKSLPPGRLPIQVKSASVDEVDLIKIHIERELERNGQVYFVAPHISMLPEVEEIIKQDFPQVKYAVINGKVKERTQKKTLRKFRKGLIKILVCTNIIGVGIDVSTVNTIIIYRANRFGLSDLYQLRGRVGRSSVQAYALIMHEIKCSDRTDIKMKALETHTGLDSAEQISNIDRMMRGDGDITGTKQSGSCNINSEILDRLREYISK